MIVVKTSDPVATKLVARSQFPVPSSQWLVNSWQLAAIEMTSIVSIVIVRQSKRNYICICELRTAHNCQQCDCEMAFRARNRLSQSKWCITPAHRRHIALDPVVAEPRLITHPFSMKSNFAIAIGSDKAGPCIRALNVPA